MTSGLYFKADTHLTPSNPHSTLDFLSTILKVHRSNSARMLSRSVVLVLFIVQVVAFLPSTIGNYQRSVDHQFSVEKARLGSIFAMVDTSSLLDSDNLLSEDLVGLVLLTGNGQLLLNTGNTLEFKHADASFNKSLSIRTHRFSIDSRSGELDSIAFVDVKNWLMGAIKRTLIFLFCAFLISLAAGLITLCGITRYYYTPLRSLTSALRQSRGSGDVQSPSTIELVLNEDLNPIIEQFNGLIDAQIKSARQVKVKQQYLEFAAHHDPLTHLPNRLMFEDALKKTVSSSIEESLHFAVFLVDLDNFKFFNDQYGHLIGDKMVTEIGNRLRTMMRDIDLVARLDGDEFVVIQRNVSDYAIAEEVAKRIMCVAAEPYEYRGFTLKAAVSVGISCFPADVHIGQDLHMLGEEIVNNAAVALQEAKGNGKNQYQLFNEKMRSRLTARIRLEQDLKLALQDGQFEVFYQPKINIHTRECTGSEALVRWRHPVNGFVSPDAFVPLAEETGLIVELGEWILNTACERTKALQLKGYEGLNVAVNISAVQFADGNLLPMISKALDESGLLPEFLELEITESAVMDDPEYVISSLHELSEFGMRLAIDDFGTGYSSLAYLKRFPVNTLKIDRAFITDISSDNDDVAIVEAVLGLGKHFNMKVVAEGVEDEEQLVYLKSQGCDIAQGYFISKPLSEKQFINWLERWPYGVAKANESSLMQMAALPDNRAAR